ncbi:MAG: lipoprotein signal peptidase [Muribaculaceae bacterium]|nr:lipoprotein signal peptidase [Muribaculaceae bacterium]
MKNKLVSAGNIGIFLAGIILIVVLADQILKIWVKTHFYMGEGYEITPWFFIKFIENNGMAFGMELSSKLILTFGRIIAVILLIWGLWKIKGVSSVRLGFLVCVALIIAGAAGNVFDCVFYGEIFNNPAPPEVATLFPEGGGYAGWFEGRVVDMLYFPFFGFTWPDWMPMVGGRHFEFFQYIFNLADASITVGVLVLIFFYSSDLGIAWKALMQKVGRGGSDDKVKKEK